MGYNNDNNHYEYYCNIFNDVDQYVGYCKYYKPEELYNDVSIEYININDLDRRHGYATEMVKELMRKYNFKWDGQFTEDGKLWYNGMLEKKVIDP